MMANRGNQMTQASHCSDQIRAVNWVLLHDRPFLARETIRFCENRVVFVVNLANIMKECSLTNALNIAFGEPTMAVDTHIFRIGNRTGLAPGKDPLAVELKLLEVIPEKYMMHAHHWLILHGRYTCLARRPLCEKCVIADFCKWPGKTVLMAPDK